MKSSTIARCYTAGVRAANNKKQRVMKVEYKNVHMAESWLRGYDDLKAGLVKVNEDGSWSTSND